MSFAVLDRRTRHAVPCCRPPRSANPQRAGLRVPWRATSLPYAGVESVPTNSPHKRRSRRPNMLVSGLCIRKEARTITTNGGGGSGPAPDHQVQTRRSRWSRGLPYAAARAVALLNFGPDVPSREKRRAFCYPGGRYYRWYEYDRSTWCATREHGHSPRHGDNRIFGTHSFSGGPDGARSRCRAACS